jgi:hypothetical protein
MGLWRGRIAWQQELVVEQSFSPHGGQVAERKGDNKRGGKRKGKERKVPEPKYIFPGYSSSVTHFPQLGPTSP